MTAGYRSSTLAEQGPRLDAFDNYPGFYRAPDFLRREILTHRFSKVADIGGGANPLLDTTTIREYGIDYSLLDISQVELEKAPAYYHKIQVDVTAPLGDFCSRVGKEEFDLIFSHNFLEHVQKPLRVHQNIHAALKPGGLAIHFHPSPFNLPLMINQILPEKITNAFLRVAQPKRDIGGREGKFVAFYRMCGVPSKRLHAKFNELGFDVVRHTGFIGHEYYDRIPLARDLERRLRRLLLNARIPMISTSLLILRKRMTQGPE